MTKTFVMCVGSQKAGTSWLWHYLRQNPSIHLGFKKELHTWDATTIDEYAFFKSNLEQIASSDPDKLMQLSFMQNYEDYFSYFIQLLTDFQVVGDFTPQYSALSEHTYTRIINTFKTHNVETKAIFLLRDPVDRLQSMMRMKLKQQGVTNPLYETELSMMIEHSKSENYYYTGDYSIIVPKLDKVFQHNVHYNLYDTLFCDQSTQAICNFLNVPFNTPDYIFNPISSKTSNVLTPTDRQYFEHLYKHIYDYTAERFPEVRKLWTYYQK